MKCPKFASFCCAAIFSSSVFASDDISSKSWATQIGTQGVFLRQQGADQSGFFVGARFAMSRSDWNNDTGTDKWHSLGVSVGYRSYIGSAELRKFLDTSLGYAENDSNDGFRSKLASANFLYGMEYALTQQFGVEGAAGVSLDYAEYGDENFNGKDFSVFAPATRIAVNYYF